jgi:glucose-6-phosphate isomerase
MSDTTVVPDTKEWKALQTYYESARALKLRDLFAADPGRAERFSVEAAGLFLGRVLRRRRNRPPGQRGCG